MTIGKDRGKKAKIERIDRKGGSVILPGINMYKKHMKRRDEKHPGGIIDVLRPLSVSKVALVCPSCNKITRVGYVVMRGGKERICRKCQQRL